MRRLTLKKQTKVILSVVLAILIAVDAVLIIFIAKQMTGGDENAKSVTDYLDMAQKYLDDMDEESAIRCYWSAINVEPKNEKPYLKLGQLYEDRNQFNDAVFVYGLGLERTGLSTFEDLIARLQKQAEAGAENGGEVAIGKAQTLEPSFNSVFANKLVKYTYSEYQKEFGQPTISTSTELYTVVYPGLSATCFYRRADGVIQNAGTPYQISLNDVSLLFSNMGEQVTFEQLKGMSLRNLKQTSIESGKRMKISFVFAGALFEFSCNKGEGIRAHTENNVFPGGGGAPAVEKGLFTLDGVITNAVTGRGVANAVLTLRLKDPNSDIEFETATTKTNVNGEYTFEDLPATDFILKAEATGFVSEEFAITIDEDGTADYTNFVISPVLQTGEIRIVLTWNEEPRDLDAHLVGRYEDGTNVHVSFMNQTEKNRNGDVLAELDVDDRSGFGPETMTIHDTGGSYDYDFIVHDYEMTQKMAEKGATVKIYTQTGAPITVDVPSDVVNYWHVCSIHDGEVSIVNTAYSGNVR